MLACSQLRLLPGVGWMLALLVWIAVYLHAFQILRNAADGHPEASEVLLNEDTGLAIRFVLVYILLYGLLLAMYALLPAAGVVLLVALTLLQPSFLTATVLNGSVIRSLDPTLTVQMIQRIGAPYIAVSAFLFVMQLGVVLAGRVVNAGHLPLVGEIVMAGLTIWSIFAGFHLLGQLVHEYSDVLGHDALDDPARPADVSPADQRILDQVQRHLDEQRTDRARELLRADVLGRAPGLPVHAAYRELLAAEPWGALHAEHYPLHIEKLLAEQHTAQASHVAAGGAAGRFGFQAENGGARRCVGCRSRPHGSAAAARRPAFCDGSGVAGRSAGAGVGAAGGRSAA